MYFRNTKCDFEFYDWGSVERASFEFTQFQEDDSVNQIANILKKCNRLEVVLIKLLEIKGYEKLTDVLNTKSFEHLKKLRIASKDMTPKKIYDFYLDLTILTELSLLDIRGMPQVINLEFKLAVNSMVHLIVDDNQYAHYDNV